MAERCEACLFGEFEVAKSVESSVGWAKTSHVTIGLCKYHAIPWHWNFSFPRPLATIMIHQFGLLYITIYINLIRSFRAI
jgi:hypothetical protein